jgi:hypothetical protein
MRVMSTSTWACANAGSIAMAQTVRIRFMDVFLAAVAQMGSLSA